MASSGAYEGLRITEIAEGAEIDLVVSPGSSRDRLLGVHGGALKLSVTAAPEKGKANRAVVALLARELGLRQKDVRIVAGAASRRKRAVFPGLPPKALRERLESAP